MSIETPSAWENAQTEAIRKSRQAMDKMVAKVKERALRAELKFVIERAAGGRKNSLSLKPAPDAIEPIVEALMALTGDSSLESLHDIVPTLAAVPNHAAVVLFIRDQNQEDCGTLQLARLDRSQLSSYTDNSLVVQTLTLPSITFARYFLTPDEPTGLRIGFTHLPDPVTSRVDLFSLEPVCVPGSFRAFSPERSLRVV